MKNYVAIGMTALISALLATANPALAKTDKKYISLCTKEVRENMKNPYTFRVRASAVIKRMSMTHLPVSGSTTLLFS